MFLKMGSFLLKRRGKKNKRMKKGPVSYVRKVKSEKNLDTEERNVKNQKRKNSLLKFKVGTITGENHTKTIGFPDKRLYRILKKKPKVEPA